MANKTSEYTPLMWLVVVLCGVAIVAAIIILLWKPGRDITNFQECKAAGGAIMESYPEQCALDGKTFTNDTQVAGDTSDYIGLTEQAALDKAAAANKAARVVERDGKSLPVTMDFYAGRLNFSVKDGKVSKVQVEGQEN